MQPWDQVQVIDEHDDRAGQAGLVLAATAETVTVRFDVDSEKVSYPVASLRLLGR